MQTAKDKPGPDKRALSAERLAGILVGPRHTAAEGPAELRTRAIQPLDAADGPLGGAFSVEYNELERGCVVQDLRARS